MSEHVNYVALKAEIDTNKQTYRTTTVDLVELVEWWNAHADVHGGPTYTLTEDAGDHLDKVIESASGATVEEWIRDASARATTRQPETNDGR